MTGVKYSSAESNEALPMSYVTSDDVGTFSPQWLDRCLTSRQTRPKWWSSCVL